jgi:hypothetical protein
MATNRFRQKRNTKRNMKRNTKRQKKGGSLGIQNPNKSAKDNYEDWELLKFRYPADNYVENKLHGNKYEKYNPEFYYYSYWKNFGKEPEKEKYGKIFNYTKPSSRNNQDNWSIWGVK